MVISIHSETAFTAETPTPCNPPETLYASLSNLPPACSLVMITSAAEIPNSSWIPTGIPRPKSLTDREPSFLRLTNTESFLPARCSSTALSTTSQIQWCKPEPSFGSPIYIPGLFLTASSPSRTCMLDALYSSVILFTLFIIIDY